MKKTLEKAAKVAMYVFGGGAIFSVAASLIPLAVGRGDIDSETALMWFGIGCVAGLLYGIYRKFA